MGRSRALIGARRIVVKVGSGLITAPGEGPVAPRISVLAADLAALQRAILQFIAEWNDIAHPFRWTTHSFEKILAKVDAALAATPSVLATAA